MAGQACSEMADVAVCLGVASSLSSLSHRVMDMDMAGQACCGRANVVVCLGAASNLYSLSHRVSGTAKRKEA